MSYVYIWRINKDISFSYEASDIEMAKNGIINNIYKICLDHEKASNYIIHINDKYYSTLEKQLRLKICDVLCHIGNMNYTEANLLIDTCYDTNDYSIVYRTIIGMFKDYQPIVNI